MTVPLISLAQVRILQEEVIEAANAPDKLPEDLAPATAFDETAVRAGLPGPGPFRVDDLRWFDRRHASPKKAANPASAVREPFPAR
jgi:hypothetical protein